MKYQRIKTNPLERISRPTSAHDGVHSIWDTEERGELPSLIDGEGWVEITPQPEYNSNSQKLKKVFTELVDGWEVVDLNEAELIQRVNESAEAHKQARLALAKKRAEDKELALIETEAESMTDAEAEQNPELFPPFEIGKEYSVDDRFTFQDENAVYKVLQSHTSALQWKPNEAVSLYVKVQTSNEWVAGVAYEVGVVVDYQGTSYSVIQPHTSQVGWEPPNVPTLWAVV